MIAGGAPYLIGMVHDGGWFGNNHAHILRRRVSRLDFILETGGGPPNVSTAVHEA
jgi:hypothetical protein